MGDMNTMDIFGAEETKKENYHSTEPSVDDTLNYVDKNQVKIYTDYIQKSLLSNARFTGFLLKQVIPELKDITLDDFCIAVGADPISGKGLECCKTEYGLGGLKEVRLDIIFDVDFDGEPSIKLRIDIEPQSSQQTFRPQDDGSYSLVQRGIYYGALTMSTSLKNKESYHKIHKVYSIWLCYKNPLASCNEPIIRYKMQPAEDYRYTDGSSILNEKHKFDSGDLLEVIFISVNNLHDNVREQLNLKNLLQESSEHEQRKEFYEENGIISEEGGIGMPIIEYEELKQVIEKQYKEDMKVAEQRIEERLKKQYKERMKEIGKEIGKEESAINHITRMYHKGRYSSKEEAATQISDLLGEDIDFVRKVLQTL